MLELALINGDFSMRTECVHLGLYTFFRKEVEPMGTAERRREIMKILCRRRHETIKNIARELGVSERTIRRDVDVLSSSEPIYTMTGRYLGGVYVVEGYSLDKVFLTDDEIAVLSSLHNMAENHSICILSERELEILKRIIVNGSKPQVTKGRIK